MAHSHAPTVALRRRPTHRGQAIVEVALILPLLLVLTLGVVDLARVFTSYIALADGVREGALYAAQGTNNTRWCSGDAGDVVCPPSSDPLVNETHDNVNIAFQISAAGLDVDRIDMLDPVCDPSPCDATSTITIAATYEMDFLIPVLSDLLGSQSVTVTAETTAKVLP